MIISFLLKIFVTNINSEISNIKNSLDELYSEIGNRNRVLCEIRNKHSKTTTEFEKLSKEFDEYVDEIIKLDQIYKKTQDKLEEISTEAQSIQETTDESTTVNSNMINLLKNKTETHRELIDETIRTSRNQLQQTYQRLLLVYNAIDNSIQMISANIKIVDDQIVTACNKYVENRNKHDIYIKKRNNDIFYIKLYKYLYITSLCLFSTLILLLIFIKYLLYNNYKS